MIEKLNVKYIYRSNGYKSDSNLYYLYDGSYRSKCHRCVFHTICPYSYMNIYYTEEGNCIKCLRFIPMGEYSYKYVSLYSAGKIRDMYMYFTEGKFYD